MDTLKTVSGMKVYNIGIGEGYSVKALIHAYEKACGRKIPYVIEPRCAGDIAVCYCDPAKAENADHVICDYSAVVYEAAIRNKPL